MASGAAFSVKKLVAFAPDMVKAIEDYRFANRIGSESEAIRRLIEAGLQRSPAEVVAPGPIVVAPAPPRAGYLICGMCSGRGHFAGKPCEVCGGSGRGVAAN
jgi:hypothetical protein